MKSYSAVLALGLALASAQPALAQGRGVPRPGGFLDPGTASEQVPDILEKVGVDQKLNAQVPLDLTFRDETGRQVRLGDYFGTKPVLLTLVYYECPMLCTQVLNGTVGALKTLNLTAGQDFEIVTLSFNPRETPAEAAEKKATYVAKYGRPGVEAGWHFLTGEQPAIEAVAGAVGFRYAFDQATGQYVHTTAIMILTPQGRVSKYFYGIEYPPRDIRLGLVDASGGAIGTPVDQVLLYCFHYDPHAGRYSVVIMNVLRLAGVVTVALILGFIGVMALRERRKSRIAGAAAHGTTH